MRQFGVLPSAEALEQTLFFDTLPAAQQDHESQTPESSRTWRHNIRQRLVGVVAAAAVLGGSLAMTGDKEIPRKEPIQRVLALEVGAQLSQALVYDNCDIRLDEQTVIQDTMSIIDPEALAVLSNDQLIEETEKRLEVMEKARDAVGYVQRPEELLQLEKRFGKDYKDTPFSVYAGQLDSLAAKLGMSTLYTWDQAYVQGKSTSPFFKTGTTPLSDQQLDAGSIGKRTLVGAASALSSSIPRRLLQITAPDARLVFGDLTDEYAGGEVSDSMNNHDIYIDIDPKGTDSTPSNGQSVIHEFAHHDTLDCKYGEDDESYKRLHAGQAYLNLSGVNYDEKVKVLAYAPLRNKDNSLYENAANKPIVVATSYGANNIYEDMAETEDTMLLDASSAPEMFEQGENAKTLIAKTILLSERAGQKDPFVRVYFNALLHAAVAVAEVNKRELAVIKAAAKGETPEGYRLRLQLVDTLSRYYNVVDGRGGIPDFSGGLPELFASDRHAATK